MAALSEDQAESLRARLREHDIPVNALARVLGISEKSIQRFLGGKYVLPVELAKVLEGVIEFRSARK